jgi:hypothetical protein
MKIQKEMRATEAQRHGEKKHQAFIRVQQCASVVPFAFLCASASPWQSPHKRQLRGSCPAGGLEIRNRIARIKPCARAAILHSAGVPRRGDHFNAPSRNGVLRGGVAGIGADAEVHQRGIANGHAHAVDRRDNRRPRHGVHGQLLFHVIWIRGHGLSSVSFSLRAFDSPMQNKINPTQAEAYATDASATGFSLCGFAFAATRKSDPRHIQQEVLALT